MCNQPISRINDDTGEVVTFACRVCDACIAARRAGWVARAIAENTLWQHAVCVTLTYDDKAPGGYDAARFFCYADVRAFVQRITSALRRIDRKLSVRFLCAGEQGDRTNRCHWHLILWSHYDLRTLGQVRYHSSERPMVVGHRVLKRGDLVTDPDPMMTVGKDERRFHWSLWAEEGYPKGIITFGAADEAGAAYVVSYCLKDQFTIEKSAHAGRISKAENFATGLFRMSKRPAIGEGFVMQLLQDLAEQGAVLPNTHLSVPGLSGFYYPTRTLREKLLVGFRAINDERRASGRGDCPQWDGLVASCKDNPKDMECLYGPKEETRPLKQLVYRKGVRDAETERRYLRAAFERRWETVCQTCLTGRGETVRWLRGNGETRFEAVPSGLEARGLRGFGSGAEGACCETCLTTKDLWAIARQARPGETKGA